MSSQNVEVSGNAAMTCRYFGTGRQVYYTWLRRYETEGVNGLRERSKRPRTSPNATQAEAIEKIIPCTASRSAPVRCNPSAITTATLPPS
jgi:transposase